MYIETAGTVATTLRQMMVRDKKETSHVCYYMWSCCRVSECPCRKLIIDVDQLLVDSRSAVPPDLHSIAALSDAGPCAAYSMYRIYITIDGFIWGEKKKNKQKKFDEIPKVRRLPLAALSPSYILYIM